METIRASLSLYPSAEGGLHAPMKSPTRSLVLIFRSDFGRKEADVQVGVVVHGLDIDVLHPGETVMVDLEFWSDLERSFAVEGAEFKAWYAGRIVGSGRVLDSLTGRDGTT